MLKTIKKLIKTVIFRFIKIPVHTINNSNAQAGEDRVLEYLFNSMNITSIKYIDIGTNDPVACNNTYLFYCKGNTGVLVEPDPGFHYKILQSRPNDRLIDAAISDNEDGEMNFYVFNDPAISTLSADEASLRQASGLYKLTEEKKIKTTTIEKIIKNDLDGELPDLISLDVEGYDLKILTAFDFEKFPVPVWLIETCSYTENHIKPKVMEIQDLMLKNGYFVFADTYINTIFVNQNWFNNRHNG